jgi:ribonuclease-3
VVDGLGHGRALHRQPVRVGNPLARHGVDFTDRALLERALTHRSVGPANYERLEFLGDALVNTIVSILLYERHPRAPEGELTRLRAALIRESSLAEVARSLDLSEYLLLGGGELKSGGYRRDSILADTLEALVAAVFLDRGWEACRSLVEALFLARIDAVGHGATKDAKTRLQECLQARGMGLPNYHLVDAVGKDHEKLFHVECRVAALSLAAVASGRSRKAAEQAAAAAVLQQLSETES